MNERRWDGGAWVTLAAAAFLVAAHVIPVIASLWYPSDGWASDRMGLGAHYRLYRPVWAEPGPLQVGDRIVAINGQPMRPGQRPPLPADLYEGQVLRYAVERDTEGQTGLFWVEVTLARPTPADILQASMDSALAQPEITFVPTLSFLVALVVFLLRPGSPAARYLLMIFSFYGPSSFIAWAAGTLYAAQFPLPVALLQQIGPKGWGVFFFPSWILLTLSLPVRKWPLTRYPRLTPALIYGVPLAVTAPGVVLETMTGDPGIFGLLYNLLNIPVLSLFLAALFGGLIHNFITLRDPAARAQLRWIAFGMGVGWGLPIGLANLLLLADLTPAHYLGILWPTVLMPVCLAIAVLRYRLWDIDVIIRRTLQYSVLSGLLALVYFGLIVILQGLFTTVTGQSSSVATVLSTLAIAALFLPLRRRVQDFIDKRFFRQKYDAQKVLAEFAATCRDETDLEALTTRLVDVVRETMQPESVVLWLKPDTSRSKKDGWA